jgi:hypothetical protein
MLDNLLDPLLAEILDASSLSEHFRNKGHSVSRAESINFDLPAPASRYAGPDQAVQLERDALLRDMLGSEFSPDDLRRMLPPAMRIKESVRVLKAHRLWPRMVRAAVTLLEKDPENKAAQIVVCLEKNQHTLARSVIKRAIGGSSGIHDEPVPDSMKVAKGDSFLDYLQGE